MLWERVHVLKVKMAGWEDAWTWQDERGKGGIEKAPRYLA